MKKNGIILIGLLVLVTLFVGCSQDALGDYKKAVDKTDSITMGKSTTTGSITVDVDTTGLNDADRKQADLLKDISFKTTKMTNTKDLKSTTIGYLNFGGMGFDYGIYVNGEEKYIKIPVVNKFMALNELTKNTDFSSYNYAEMISPETIKQLEKIWMDNLKNNNIFKGSNTVVETGDGSVKVKKYTLSMDHNEMDQLMPRFMDVILKDEKLIRYIESRSDEKIEPDQMAVIIKKNE